MRLKLVNSSFLIRVSYLFLFTLVSIPVSHACTDAACACGCAGTGTFNCPTGETERFCVQTDIDGDGVPEETCFDKAKTAQKTVCVSCLTCPKPDDGNDSGEESAD